MEAKAVLDRIRQLLAPEGAWTQKAYARDADGLAVNPENPAACSWSLLGAMQRVKAAEPAAGDGVKRAIEAVHAVVGPEPIDWNDSTWRKQAHVLKVLEMAREEL